MTFETAKKFIDALLNDEIEDFTTKNTGGVAIEFIGGEPLMEIELIEQIWEYLLHQLIVLNHPWQYHLRGSLCSNGILYFSEKF
jgi:sulfatase maturation enzyme AslB (radical SAM superfamily)